MADEPIDPALRGTDHYSEQAILRARQLVDSVPDQIGPYRIRERIGGGGMGEVFRAEQKAPIRREVALKFIKLGMDTKAVIARFEAERQALALMDHPHIAKVLDAGADDAGRPFFVMEYVKGKPITEYADRNQLSIAERVELVEQVCQAIQHAHHKGVIHRDLKPSNVLVATQDGNPFAKVIDFGIAKAIGQQLTDKTLYTLHDQFVGTPQYMSPEQAEGSLDIDTRTDVYSLGVLLYELLAGSPPFSTTDAKLAAFDQLKRMILEVEPQRPSTRLTSNVATLPALAASRRTEPKRLGPLIRGELDWIVMKALDKDRKRRYETPASLARDLHAHLTGVPIQAAPPSTLYQFRKFLYRNRGPVSALAALGLLLILGLGATTWGYFWAIGLAESERTAKRDAEAAQKVAEAAGAAALEAESRALAALRETEDARLKEAEQAERARENERKAFIAAEAAQQAEKRAENLATIAQENERKALVAAESARLSRDATEEKDRETKTILDFIEQRILTVARPKDDQSGLGVDVTLRQAILSALPYLNDSLLNQPLTEARLRTTFGAALDRLGDTTIARDQFSLAFGLYSHHLGLQHAATIQSMLGVGEAFHKLGQHEDAKTIRAEALRAAETGQGDTHPLTQRCRVALASTYNTLKDFQIAESLLLKALKHQQQLFPASRPDIILTRASLADSWFGLGRPEEALKLREELIEETATVFGPAHSQTLAALVALADLYQAIGRKADNKRVRETIDATRQEVQQHRFPITQGDSRALRVLYRRLGKWDLLIKQHEDDLEEARRAQGGKHDGAVAALEALAVAYGGKGDRAKSIEIYQQALQLSREVNGAGGEHTLAIQVNLENALAAIGRHEDAVTLAKETVRLAAQHLPHDHRYRLDALETMANSLIRLGCGPEAMERLKEAIAICREAPQLRGHFRPVYWTQLTYLQSVRDLNGLQEMVAELEELRLTDPDSLFLAFYAHCAIANLFSEAQPVNAESIEQASSKALAALEHAVRSGFVLTVEQLGTNPQFRVLHGHPELEQIIGQLRLKGVVTLRNRLETLRSALGPAHAETLKTWKELIALSAGHGLRDETLALSEDLLANLRAGNEPATELVPALRHTAAQLLQVEECERATAYLDELLRILAEKNLAKSPAAIAARVDRAAALARMGRKVDAVAGAAEAVALVSSSDQTDEAFKQRIRGRQVDVLLEAGAIDDALASLVQLSNEQPNDALLALKVAALHAWYERHDELQVLRSAALEKAEKTDLPEVVERLSKVCAFTPNPDRDQLTLARDYVSRTIEQHPKHGFIHYFYLALGMAEYRLGHDEAALAALEKANPSRSVTRLPITITVAFYQAMAAERLGRHEDAARWQKLAVEQMQSLPAPGRNPLDRATHDHLIYWLASRECAALVNSQRSNKSPQSTSGINHSQ